MKINLRALMAVAVCAVLLAACGGSSDSPSADATPGEVKPADVTLVVASAIIGPKEEVAMFAVAQKMGYFEQEKLTVRTINADGSIAAVQAVGSGKGDITPSDSGSILSAVQKNVPVQAVGGLVQNWPWQIATLPGSPLSTPEGMKGKKIGVISLASGSAPYARAFVRAGGLDPEKDVQLLPVGVGAQAAAALTSGKVDALALYTQAYTAIENAGTKLSYLDNPDVFDGIRSLNFAVNKEQLDESPQVYERFLRAAYKAMLFSANNPEAAMQIGYQVWPQILAGADPQSRLADDVASLTAWIKSATPKDGEPATFANWGAVSDQDWAKTQAYTKEAGQITADVPLDKVWSDKLLQAANDFDSAAVVKQATGWKP